ncbi:UNVERIFIED_CONTAM: hypothetical protein Sradi_1968000 [Sesamum radiatum]|uniref:Uncharacterized protein n=1 Tax=Sesamum radiatum TaxID=300843 RepID=A0AAW2TFD5_SESRA
MVSKQHKPSNSGASFGSAPTFFTSAGAAVEARCSRPPPACSMHAFHDQQRNKHKLRYCKQEEKNK